MDQQYLISVSDDQSAKIWYIDTGENLVTFREHSNYVHIEGFCRPDIDGFIENCSFVMKDEYVASIDAGRTVYVWSVQDGSILHTFKNIKNWCANSIGRNSKRSYRINIGNRECLVLSTFDHQVRVVDVESGIDVFVFDGHTERNPIGMVSADGRILISADDYDNGGTIRFWELNKK
jgi:WD40 repeat protein